MMNSSVNAYRMKQKAPMNGMWLSVFVLTLVLVVLNQVFVNVFARQAQDYSAQVAALRISARALASNAAAAGSGDAQALAGLQQDRQVLATAMDRLNADQPALLDKGIGMLTGLPAPQQVISSSFSIIPQSWQKLSAALQALQDKQPQLTAFYSQAEALAALAAEYQDIASQLQQAGLAQVAVDAVQTQAMLAEALAVDLKLLTAGQLTAAQNVLFSGDLERLQSGRLALQQGSIMQLISGVDGASFSARLDAAGDRLAAMQMLAEELPAAAPVLSGAAQDLAVIGEESVLLQQELERLAAHYGTLSPMWPASPLTGYALLLLMLLSIAIYVTKVIRLSREAELYTAEKNQRNNHAALKLIGEISSLADGDLTVEATVSEEFTGPIAESVNYAVAQLRGLVSAITEATLEVSGSTATSTQLVGELSAASQRQSKSIDDIYEAIRRIGSGISLVSDNARRSRDVAENSVQTAAGGAEVVKDTIRGMDSIRDQIQDTSKRIKRLGESSQEIGSFVSLINDIAEHTNTLSLNAAIQAASAGEAGKGFAVVADEVHALAQRSGDATRQIESLVKVIQNDIKEAVQSMEQTTSQVVTGTGLAQRAGTALDDIQRVSRELAELVSSITEASQNQHLAASELSSSMEVIKQVTSVTTEGIEDTRRFIMKLGDLTDRLKQAVSGFSLVKKNKWARLQEQKAAQSEASAPGLVKKDVDAGSELSMMTRIMSA